MLPGWDKVFCFADNQYNTGKYQYRCRLGSDIPDIDFVVTAQLNLNMSWSLT